jgi:hypothetical protein
MSQAVKDSKQTDGRHHDDGRRDEHNNEELSIGRHVLSASPLVWVLLVGAVTWAAWATVSGSSSSSSKTTLRALLLPTRGSDRMVMALPCGSGSGSGSQSPTGGTSVLVPSGSGLRVLLVAGCQSSGGSAGGGGGSSGSGSSGGAGSSGGGSSGGSSSGPAPVIVLPPGTPPPKSGGSLPSSLHVGSGAKITNIVAVPADARTVLVTPCQSTSGGSSGGASGRPVPSGHGVLLLPPCGGGSG